MTKLYVHEWGGGDRIAVLIHGITSDSGSWWRFGPELAERGYHVLAPHLRGHGHSPRGRPYTLASWTDDVIESLPAEPELVVGHSLGGLILADGVRRLRPRRVVYEDPAWFTPTTGREDAVARFRAQKGWTLSDIQNFYPRWQSGAYDARLAALQRWDPDTTEFITAFGVSEPAFEPAPPTAPALLMLADPSNLVVPDRAAELAKAGFEVRVVKDAGHVIHNDDYAGFLAALDGWL
jgi:pimeloyl-ACP methyl ester carboxylesterase